jgi:hypothetical protein
MAAKIDLADLLARIERVEKLCAQCVDDAAFHRQLAHDRKLAADLRERQEKWLRTNTKRLGKITATRRVWLHGVGMTGLVHDPKVRDWYDVPRRHDDVELLAGAYLIEDLDDPASRINSDPQVAEAIRRGDLVVEPLSDQECRQRALASSREAPR